MSIKGSMDLMPTFLIIGAAKAGTTAIYDYLGQHPDVFLTTPKEPNFFALEGQRLDFRGPGDSYTINHYSVTGLSGYSSLFKKGIGKIARGEASVLYMYSQTAPERIRHYVPNVRMIAMLRNPIERAYSAYLFAKRDNREPSDDFMEALDAEHSRISQGWEHLFHYVEVGRYRSQLERYYRIFSPDQLLVLLYEDFVRDNRAVLTSIFRHIGVDDHFTPDTTYRPFASGIPRVRGLQNLLFKPYRWKRPLRWLLPERARSRWKEAISARNVVRPGMPDDAAQRLHAVFRDEILKLEDTIGRDLSVWLQQTDALTGSAAFDGVRQC